MKKDQEITILIEDPEDRPRIPISGAWGGPSPDGSQVIAHVYLEHSTIPSMFTHEVAEDGSVDLKKGERITRGNLTRTVLASLVFTPESAMSMGRWLVEKAEQAAQVRSGNPPGGNP